MESKLIIHTGNSVEDAKSRVIEEIKILLSLRIDMVFIHFETTEEKGKITSIATVYFENNV